MAMFDYGFIMTKNNQMITVEDLIDKDLDYMIGDRDFNIEIIRTRLVIHSGDKIIDEINGTKDYGLPYKKSYKKYRLQLDINGIKLNIKRLGQAQYKLRFWYKDDVYVCVYGYAVGEKVYKWWKNGLRVSKKEYEYCKSWYKYLK